jgi:N6-L-threonylcarbamoyladenine synthase
VARCGLRQLVVAGGVGANRRLRERLDAQAGRTGFAVFYPELELCTDNGAMIAFAGALRLEAAAQRRGSGAFSVRPRWPLQALSAPAEGA